MMEIAFVVTIKKEATNIEYKLSDNNLNSIDVAKINSKISSLLDNYMGSK